MPRTKVQRKKQNNVAIDQEEINLRLLNLETMRKNHKDMLENEHKKMLSKWMIQSKGILMNIPESKLNKTLAELANNMGSESTIDPSVISILNSTKKFNSIQKSTRKRSNSLVDDEGYLTAESSNGTTGGKAGRSRVRETVARSRGSRSLSRTKTSAKYKTPRVHRPPRTYGTVTPKVTPNTPQVLLRRPNQGEVALSLQGSPLYTGSMVTESVANINIPLTGGRLLSIQPRKGLRMSQIPEIDLATKRQLETLRDNLNKVCASTSTRR